jgi:hypothetical protein
MVGALGLLVALLETRISKARLSYLRAALAMLGISVNCSFFIAIPVSQLGTVGITIFFFITCAVIPIILNVRFLIN